MEIIHFRELDARGIKVIAPGILIFQQQKFKIGPAFAKRWLKSALKFAQIVQADCLMIEHETYFTVWVCYRQRSAKATSSRVAQKPQSLDQAFIQACQAALVEIIGPIGQILVQKAQQASTAQTPRTFVEILVQSIPDPEKAKAFRDQLLPDLSQDI